MRGADLHSHVPQVAGPVQGGVQRDLQAAARLPPGFLCRRLARQDQRHGGRAARTHHEIDRGGRAGHAQQGRPCRRRTYVACSPAAPVTRTQTWHKGSMREYTR